MATADAESIARGYHSLSSIFRTPVQDAKTCYRCRGAVYHAEKIGPVNEVVYHKSCFRCAACGQHLTMKTYFTSQISTGDKEIYCQIHFPRIGTAGLDEGAMGIRRAVAAQKEFKRMSSKLNPEIRKPGTMRIPNIDSNAVAIRRVILSQKAQDYTAAHNAQVARVSVGPDAIGIKQQMAAQKLQEHARSAYQPRYKKKLTEAQKQLEQQLKKEEDELFRTFQQERELEKKKLNDEIKKEWEVKLKELTDMYEREMQKKKKKIQDNERKHLTIQFESQKKELEKSIKVKREKKKESITLRLKDKEQNMTATMVKKQSQQMLELLAQKKEELKQDLEKELESKPPEIEDAGGGTEVVKEIIQTLEVLEGTAPSKLPPPHPPNCRKKDIYTDPSVFDKLDDRVIEVAQNEQMSYTDLVNQLTDGLLTNLEKVRAIYRWITVKDLNVMEFDDTLDADTPMGLLRGIKYGTETYHVLFMRLCSYAGLHCVEIKGHSKSVGYEPGMKIQPDMFQNTWNAVLIDNDWRLVQCNWGARHLVLNKDKRKDKKASSNTKDQIRYQYDEHYFLTDPDEFIQEFWPNEAEWQLLEAPITLEEFEALPFVRSVFFHFGMQFDKPMPAVIDTNDKGGADIRIRIPEKYESDLVFYYQLRFADKERRSQVAYRDANLERFVFQTMVENMVMFSIHVPTQGEFFFEIFANRIDESNRVGDGEASSTISPFRLKCACKFKISCNNLSGKMHPLPDCASGEWGPKKAVRHFGMTPIYPEHSDSSSDTGSTGSNEAPDNPKAGIINVDETVDLKFKIPIPLQFVAKLKMNYVERKALETFVNIDVQGDILTISILAPQVGQFGLDIYAKPKDAVDVNTLSHACKYLLNVNKVSNPVELPKNIPRMFTRRSTWGPAGAFDELGIKPITHTDHKITLPEDKKEVTIELDIPDGLEVSGQLVREPDEDCRDYLTTTRDKQRLKFSLRLEKHGNYMLSLYARKKEGDDRSMPNVFNYLIFHKKKGDINGNVGFPVKFEEKKSTGLLRKSIFGSKKEKEKEKDKKK